MVQQEHQLVSNTLVTSINNVVSNISINRNPGSASFASVICNFCGKIGHIEKVCFRKNGFPNKDIRIYKNNSNKKICTHCGISGHTVESCYKKHGYPPGYKFSNGGKPSQINSIVSTDDVSSENCQKGQEDGNITFTPLPYQILSHIFKQNKSVDDNKSMINPAQVNQVGSLSTNSAHQVTDQSNSSTGNLPLKTNSCWVLDSGATDHACVSLSNFASYKSIKPVPINLPNDHHVLAKYSGTVVFSKRFYLRNVLYVPHFAFNLISV